MQRPFFSRIIGILTLISLLLLPGQTAPVVLAEPAAGPNDEIIYIDGSGFIRVIDTQVETGAQKIEWVSPDSGWQDFATGDFNNDGDMEIVAFTTLNRGKLTVFDPVVQNTGITPDGSINLVPWVRLHERAFNSPHLVAAGNLDQNAPGDEILIGYHVNEPNGVKYRVDVLKTTDGGRNWTVHTSQAYGAEWTYIKVGNINNSGSDDLLMARKTANDSLVEAHEVDNNFATIFTRPDATFFTHLDGAIGQIYAGGTGEVVLLRTYPGTTEVANLLLYKSNNGNWPPIEDPNNEIETARNFPHPFKVATGDFNGSGDDEIVWLRDAPAGDSATVRLVVINRGSDNQPDFEKPLDSDNGYRVLATGDVEGDGRDEIALMRSNRIRIYTSVEDGNNSLFDDHNVSTNSRSLKLANLDKNGFTAGAQLNASPTSLSQTLEAGTVKTQNLSIQIGNVGSGGDLPISVSKESNQDWYSFSVGSNTTPASIFITQFDASRLTPGTYKDKLKITSSAPNVINQPLYIPIEMIVTQASFNLSPSLFTLTSPKTDPITQTQGVLVNGLPGLTFTAAILSQPEFSAATAALGSTPTQGRWSSSGALVLGDGFSEYSLPAAGAGGVTRSLSANNWPSGLAWASASSPGSTVIATISVAISPTLMTADVGKGLLLVLADDRAGAYPNNLKISEFVVIRTDTPLFLPVIQR
ncbi:MAG: hypothetical protein KJZ86_24750 [Caldilineaceae bacterium]|nr:hypothetical protein [Caldilineaceae bacterium]